MGIPESAQIKKQIKNTRTVYYLLSFYLVIFFILALIIILRIDFVTSELDSIFMIVVPIMGLLVMLISRMIYNTMIAKKDLKRDLTQKIVHYRKSKIISWALVSGGCIFALVAAIVTSNYYYLIIFILLFGYFILVRPSNEALIKDMRLNSEESELLLKS